MVHGGVCLGRLADGTGLLISGALPGEQLTVSLHHRVRRVWFAETIAVIQASPHRVPAPCPYYGVCGGCQLQHVDAGEQLRLKREIVVDAMRRERVPLPDDVPVHGMADPWRYRWRGEFHVLRDEHGRADGRLGFNRLRSWTPVAIEDCLIHHPRITSSLPSLGALVAGVSAAAPTTLHLTVGEDGAELLVQSRPQAALSAESLDAAAAGAPVRWSTSATTLRWRGRSFRVSPGAFMQVNWTQMDRLYGLVLEAAAGVEGTVVDAYAGVGVLACALAERAERVVCIESNPEAARLGVLNARLNDLAARIRHLAQPVERVLPVAAAGAALVVLDPPRAGCAREVTAWLALAGPPRLVYVSCDPATLARDLRLLCVLGPYQVVALDLVDMFPQTHHVEAVAVLDRTDGASG